MDTCDHAFSILVVGTVTVMVILHPKLHKEKTHEVFLFRAKSALIT